MGSLQPLKYPAAIDSNQYMAAMPSGRNGGFDRRPGVRKRLGSPGVAEDNRFWCVFFLGGDAAHPVDDLGDQVMVVGLVAHRVGVGGVARQHVGLAAAAAEVPGLLRAGAAGLLHPLEAAELVEIRRLAPDPFDAVV